ncbi:hypothetical protein ABZS66_19065 [Dactylosporangium sp. NPDC005572]|uniref:hypothetical protein n=1 Tax=Dactylosporangium sp. NPDC005572 TaxID=3156889 RepID=UPI0033B919FD
MTAVKPGLAAACYACSHPGRLHSASTGCGRTGCWCTLSPDDLTEATAGAEPAPAPAVQPPDGRALNLLDPPCARCPHRRGKHQQSGSGSPCTRCACRGFTTEATDAAPAPTTPAPADAPQPPATPAPAPTAAPVTFREPADQQPVKPPRRSRRAEPSRPPAAPHGDADQEVAADVPRAAAATSDPTCPGTHAATDHRLMAVLGVDGLDQILPEVARLKTLVGREGQPGWDHVSRADVIWQTERDRREATLLAREHTARQAELDAVRAELAEARRPDVVALDGQALLAYTAWFCRRCSQRRFDPGDCPDCRRPLVPVHVLVMPREI